MLLHLSSERSTNPYQYAGGIEVIENDHEARDLLRRLQQLPPSTIFGIDCETVAVDPGEESPVGKGRIVCWSIGYADPLLGTNRRGAPLARRAFLWARALPTFRAWLGDPGVQKVGHGVWSFDKHVFSNCGFELNGIACDTLRLGRVLNASAQADHSLKGRIESLFGYSAGTFKENFSRHKCLGLEDHGEPRYRKRTVDGVKIDTLVGGNASRVGAGYEVVDLERFAADYPDRLHTLYDYASLDAKGTLELYFELRKYAETTPWTGLGGQTWGNLWQFYETVWNPFLSVLWDIERAGIRYDPSRTSDGRDRCRASCERLLGQVRSWVGSEDFNPGSGPQLTEWLYSRLGMEVPPVKGTRTALKRTKPGEKPTTEASLNWLRANGYGSKGLDDLQQWRKEAKCLQFLEALPEYVVGDRLHSVLQPEAETGRLTSKTPNLQQIPKRYDPYRIRSGFVAAPGCCLVVADFSQLEMVVLAHFLVELFNDRTLADDLATGDAHTETARRLGLPREVAKEINYGINYGKSDLGLSLSLGISQKEAKRYLDAHARAYPGIRRFQEHCFEQAKRTGSVRTLAGRTRPLGLARSDNHWERAAAFRQAANTPIQGSAADIVISAMLRLHGALSGSPLGRIVLQVHDELVVESPVALGAEALELVRSTMENPFSKPLLKVPLTVDAKVASDWYEAKAGVK